MTNEIVPVNPARSMANDTAGLTWHPDILPMQ